MANPVQFSIDDTSPTLLYSPFPDTFSLPNLAAGWNPYFLNSGFASSIGQTGVGQSQHITSRNGSSITLLWHGTSIQLFGNTTSDASFALTLDGASVPLNRTDPTPNLLASLNDLANTSHSLTLTAITPEPQNPPDSSLVVFDKAVITDPPPANFSNIIFSEHPLNDNDIDFTGQWSFLPSSGQPPFHESQNQGDRAQATFSGISVRIFGTTSPTSGNYSILLDDTPSRIYSAHSSFTSTDSLLFFASGLDPNISHHIVVRNEGGVLQLKSGGFDIFSSGEPTALPPDNSGSPSSGNNGNTTQPLPPTAPSSALSGRFAKGTIAALVLAGFLAAALLTAVLFYFCIWRPRRRRQREFRSQIEPESNYASPTSLHPDRRKFRFRSHRDSLLPSKEKDQSGVTAAVLGGGAVLDIGHIDLDHVPGPQHDDGITSPIDAPTTGIAIADDNDREHRESNKNGFARWKRDLNALSGLTTLGLKFRHSDEKSPLSDYGHGDADIENGGGNGFIYGRYDPEVDGGISGTADGGAVRHLSTRSSNRSLGRFGKKRSSNVSGSGNGKGKGRLSGRIGGSGFPFRLSSHSRRGESATSHGHSQPHDDESLSGFTSLSYASNPNLARYPDLQPPSYAASVSQQTNSGSNASSPPSVPRSVTRSPQSQSRNTSAPPSPQDAQGPGAQGEFPVSPTSTSDQQHPSQSRQDNEARPTGMHILGIGGGLAGVGGPISMRAAIRGLSPRISRVRSGERGRGKSKGKEKEREDEQQPEKEQEEDNEKEDKRQGGEPSPHRSLSDIASVGHQQSSEGAPPRNSPTPVIMPEAVSVTRSGSPLRALPPIPAPESDSSSSRSNKLQTKEQRHRPTPLRDTTTLSEPSSASFLNVQQTSPFTLEFAPGVISTSVVPPSSSSSSSSPPSSSNHEKRSKGRSTPGDAVGLGPLGTIQSFAEAAALAVNQSGGGILVEGSSGGNGNGGGEGDKGESRRLSTASRVHFEDPPTSTSASPTTPEGETLLVPLRGGKEKGKEKEKGKGKEKEKSKEKKEKRREKEEKSKFRLTPPSGQSPTSVAGTVSETTGTTNPSSDSPPATGQLPEFGPTSFLDFSSQPPSLHSRHASEGSGLERHPSSGDGHSRIWSMQLPGRNVLPPPPPSPPPGPSTPLKSKWSNTTMQTTRTESSSTNSGYGSPRSVGIVTSEDSPRSNIFPFPLSIPPSPNMPEGFTGVEPSPSLMSPTASLPVTHAPRRSEYGRHLHVPTSGTLDPSGSGQNNDGNPEHPESSHPGNTDVADSPTDSFPYSISDVHFRHSAVSDPEMDLEPGTVQYARQHTLAHPPLPSTPLTPQRFTPQQEQTQQPQSTASSIVQRVFGGSGSGTGTPRTPLSGFLKPSSS